MKSPPPFKTRNSASEEFWTERFEDNFTPWDQGDVPAALRDFAGSAQRPLTTLIPGCGKGYEVAYLGTAGWDVIAIDFSPAAVRAARAILGPWSSRVIEANFFTYNPPKQVEFIYERAFLCALPPNLWPQVVTKWSKLLKPGGLLAGFFFLGATGKGPPFAIEAAQLEALMQPHFERLEDKPVPDSVEVFKGQERWQVWRRT